MGLHQTEIKFEHEIPSFQAIKQQFEQQTGLAIQLVATIHLATGESRPLLNHPSQLLSILQADAEAVAAIDAQYESEKAMLLSTQQYEQAAAARDRTKKEKQSLNHIQNIEIAIDNGRFGALAISVERQIVTVEYDTEYYPVISFIKALVDLGGKLLNGNGLQTELPSSWRKLKRWDEYKWYNRPRR